PVTGVCFACAGTIDTRLGSTPTVDFRPETGSSIDSIATGPLKEVIIVIHHVDLGLQIARRGRSRLSDASGWHWTMLFSERAMARVELMRALGVRAGPPGEGRSRGGR